MSRRSFPNLDLISVGVLAVVTVTVQFLLEGRTGFNIGDEGFLWYGVQRVLAGEVPIRDFMAYEPGRYYWSAAIMLLIGDDGIIGLRIAVAVFQTAGLFVALLLLAQALPRTSTGSNAFLVISAIILVVWMFPRHKLFDCSLSIFQVGLVTLMLGRKTTGWSLIGGMILGLIMFFGRNHGLYGAIGVLGALIFTAWEERDLKSFVLKNICLIVGVIIGLSPLFLLVYLRPGMGQALWQSVIFIFEYGATNLAIPIPWPWRGDTVRAYIVGALFILLIVFPLFSLWLLALKRRNYTVPNCFIAAVLMSIPYAHFAFSRADTAHLAQSVFPMLFGILVLGALIRNGFASYLILGGMLVVSGIAILPDHPGWRCRIEQRCVMTQLSGENLLVEENVAEDYRIIKTLVEEHRAAGRSFLAAPLTPGAYALFGVRAPVWEIFPLFPRSRSFQELEISRIRSSNIAFAILQDVPLDGRDDLRYRNTHPLIYQYLRENFEQISPSGVPAPIEVFVLRR